MFFEQGLLYKLLMESCELHIPGTVFKNDFAIIYKRSGKDELGEIKTSKEEFIRKLRYFNNKSEIKQQDELFIHDKYPLNVFRDFILSIKTNTVNIDSANCYYFYELSSKYQYYELQEEVSKFIQARPDLRNLINQLSNQEEEEEENELNSKKEEIIAQNLDSCIQLDLLNLLPINRLIRVLNSPKRVLNDHCLLFKFVKEIISHKKECNSEQIQMLVNSLDLNKISIDELESLINDFDINLFMNQRDSSVKMKEIFDERKNLKKQVEQLNERLNQLDSKLTEFQSVSISNEKRFQQKIIELEKIQKEQKVQISKLLSQYKQKENEDKIKEEENDIEESNFEGNDFEEKLESFNIQFSRSPFAGIFDHLRKLCDNKNICEERVIDISGNNHQHSIPYSKLIDFNYNGICYSSANQPNSYIRIDFRNHSVSVSAYAIMSSNQSDPDFMQSWVLEGSNNLKKWINIDSHNYDPSLNGNSRTSVFNIVKSQKNSFRYIQLRMTGPSIQGGNTLEISRIELFGVFNL